MKKYWAIPFVFLPWLSPAGFADPPAPDFSGVWTSYFPPGQARPARGSTPDLPYTASAREKVEEYRALVADKGDNPGGWCLGTGMPGSMLGSGGYPMEVIQRPDQITIIYEAHQEIRRIYIGRNRIPEDDQFPDRNGYSQGRWEGDTLVVETAHLKEQVDQSYAHSADAHIIERYRLAAAADEQTILEAEMTMTDPEFYTAPVSAIKRWKRVPGGRLLPYECNEPDWEEHLRELREAARSRESNW